MPSAQFSIRIEAEEMEKYYRGQALSVVVKATNGLKIQFPANLLLPYITHDGVKGLFELNYDLQGKAQSLRQLSAS